MKFFLRRVFIVFGALMCLSGLRAQDVHFSQYNASPLLLNPSLAGLSEGDYRAYLNYRMQWMALQGGTAYRTIAGGGDIAVGKITKYNSFAGIGLTFYSDQSGAINLSNNRLSLSFAYHFMLDRKGTQQLSAGLEGSFYYSSINPSLATFDSQYDFNTGTFNPSGTRETFGRTGVIYGDAGLGILYNAVYKNGINFYTGFSLDHVNQPNISFEPSGQDASGGAGKKLYIKETLHGGLSFPIGNRLSIMPNYLLLIQGPTQEFDLGCSFKTVLGNDARRSTTAFHVGVQYRGVLDAIIINTRLDIKGFTCGLSYDVNISKLLPASHSVGAPEIALTYHGFSRKKPRPGFCPVMF